MNNLFDLISEFITIEMLNKSIESSEKNSLNISLGDIAVGIYKFEDFDDNAYVLEVKGIDSDPDDMSATVFHIYGPDVSSASGIASECLVFINTFIEKDKKMEKMKFSPLYAVETAKICIKANKQIQAQKRLKSAQLAKDAISQANLEAAEGKYDFLFEVPKELRYDVDLDHLVELLEISGYEVRRGAFKYVFTVSWYQQVKKLES